MSYPNWNLPQYDTSYSATPSMITPTFSGGSWTGGVDLSTIGNGLLYNIVRSADSTTAHTQFVVNYHAVRPLSVFSIIRHNATPSLSGTPAMWRVTLSNDNFSTTVWRSAWTNFYQTFFAPGSLPYGWSAGVWTGGPSQFDLQNYKSFASPIFADQIYQAQYVKVEVSDTSNSSSFFQFGGFFAGPGYQPSVNIEYGAQIGWSDESSITKGWSGVKFPIRKPRRRIAQFSFQALTVDQGMEIPFEMQAAIGITEQCFFCLDPASSYHVNRWSFLANIEQLDPLVWPSYNITSQQVRLTEVL